MSIDSPHGGGNDFLEDTEISSIDTRSTHEIEAERIVAHTSLGNGEIEQGIHDSFNTVKQKVNEKVSKVIAEYLDTLLHVDPNGKLDIFAGNIKELVERSHLLNYLRYLVGEDTPEIKNKRDTLNFQILEEEAIAGQYIIKLIRTYKITENEEIKKSIEGFFEKIGKTEIYTLLPEDIELRGTDNEVTDISTVALVQSSMVIWTTTKD